MTDGEAKQPAECLRRLQVDTRSVLSRWTPPTPQADAVRLRFLDLLDTQPDAARRDNPGAHLTASTLIVDHTADLVLLCLHGRMNKWVQLGGHCEEGDRTVAQAALREATEESGISGLRLHPHPIDLDIHLVGCRYGPALHYDVRFAALAPPGAVEVASSESHDLGWFAPDALPAPLAGATERLVAPALRTARILRAANHPRRS